MHFANPECRKTAVGKQTFGWLVFCTITDIYNKLPTAL